MTGVPTARASCTVIDGLEMKSRAWPNRCAIGLPDGTVPAGMPTAAGWADTTTRPFPQQDSWTHFSHDAAPSSVLSGGATL